jgi:hypothetical protein
VRLSGTFKAAPTAGLDLFKREVLGNSRQSETVRRIGGLEAGNEYLRGELVFDRARGHLISLSVVTSATAAAGDLAPDAIATDPNRIEIDARL